MSDSREAIRLKHDGGSISFATDREVISRIRHADAVDIEQSTSDEIRWRHRTGPWAIENDIRQRQPGYFTWERSWQNASNETQESELSLELETSYEPTWTLIPAVSYGGNQWGSGEEPKGLERDGVPWTFAAHRSTIPGATYSENEDWSIALFADDDQSSVRSACSLAPTDRGVVHRLCWPDVERPRTYIGRNEYGPAREGRVTVEPDKRFSVTAHLLIRDVEEPQTNWTATMDNAWQLFDGDVEARYGPEDLWELGLMFARESLWHDTDEFTGFAVSIHYDDGEWTSALAGHFERVEAGFQGQNIALATAFLQDYAWNGNEESLHVGERTLEWWAENAPLDSGLFQTRLYPTSTPDEAEPDKRGGWSPEEGIDTCNLGEGAYWFLRASELADEIGRPHPEWREIGLDVCEFFVENQLEDGTFGRLWSRDGECIESESTTGAFIIWPLVKAYQMTGDGTYLETAETAFETYVERDLEAVACAGGAIDIESIDKEGGWPLLMAALDLYEATGAEEYVERAEEAAYYLASWQCHYSAPLPAESMLEEIGYDTYGGTHVAAAHQCQDPWGSWITLGFLRLADLTGKEVWRERARAMWNQATIGISDGTLTLENGPPQQPANVTLPEGAQGECYMQSNWGSGTSPTLDRGDFLLFPVAWPTAFRLITLMDWNDWESFS